MKTKTVIFYLISLSFSLKAISQDSTFNFKDDYIFRKLIPALPQNWKFYEMDSQFFIERTDSVTIVDKRSLNIPNNQKIPDDTILKYGSKIKSIIIYKYEKRWPYEQILAAKSNNIQIYQQLKKLPEKYKISNFIDKSKSNKFNIVYTGSNEKETQLIEQYEKEKNDLEFRLITLPNYHTEKYSLFLKSIIGCNDENYSVIPSAASLQLYDILTLFRELTEKSSQ